MKIILSLMMLAFLSTGALAQAAQLDRVEIDGYGIISIHQNCSRDDLGYTSCPTANFRLVEKTMVIPARLGVQFGIMLQLYGTPDGAPVKLRWIVIYPPNGMTSPTSRQPTYQTEISYTGTIGTGSVRVYRFEHPWEMVPGTWTMEIWNDNRKLASQSFDVVEQ